MYAIIEGHRNFTLAISLFNQDMNKTKLITSSSKKLKILLVYIILRDLFVAEIRVWGIVIP